MLPKEGWIYEGQKDLGYASGSCELCGTKIRFEHFVYHKEVGTLIIGCECAGHLMDGDDLDYIKGEDKKMKASARREKATEERLKRNWQERNAFNAKRGLPLMSYEEYLKLCEATRKANAERFKALGREKDGR